MRIVENSYYDHVEHGRVKVIDVSKGVVTMAKKKPHPILNDQSVLSNAKQSAEGFQADAEPADVTIQAQPAVFNILGNDQE